MGLPVAIVDSVERVENALHVVAVHLDDLPSEGRPALAHAVECHHVLGVSADLQVVAVDNGHEIVQMIHVAGHSCLVDRAFALLAVAHHHIGLIRLAVHLGRNSHTDADGKSVTQRTGVHFDARHLDGGMSREHRTELSKRVEHTRFDESAGLEHRVERLHTMSLRKHEAVAFRHFGVLGIHVHDIEIECRHQVHHREVATRVTGTCLVDNLHQPAAVDFRLHNQIFCFHFHVFFYHIYI